jgi:hypothetical protein
MYTHIYTHTHTHTHTHTSHIVRLLKAKEEKNLEGRLRKRKIRPITCRGAKVKITAGGWARQRTDPPVTGSPHTQSYFHKS